MKKQKHSEDLEATGEHEKDEHNVRQRTHPSVVVDRTDIAQTGSDVAKGGC
jgi:hypothetical protein